MALKKKIGLFSEKKLLQFKYKILNHINKMRKLLISLKNKRKRISVYGASGKGQALLQFCKINKSIVDYVFDKSKLKQECFTPGTNIIIKNPNRINKLKIDYLFLLSWNIKNEIIKQEKLYKLKGGKFIVPFPKPKILK